MVYFSSKPTITGKSSRPKWTIYKYESDKNK